MKDTGSRIRTISIDKLRDYCKVPIVFHGSSVLEVSSLENGFGGIILEEKKVEPFSKDYDAMQSPLSWPERFDISNWRFFLAVVKDQPVGAAALAMRTPDVRMLEGKDDLACLWDIRVHPGWRGRGIGSALFQSAAREARDSGCAWIKVETQNNNVAANRFYHSQGCHLAQIHLHAYYHETGCSDEVMLVWYINLEQQPEGQ